MNQFGLARISHR